MTLDQFLKRLATIEWQLDDVMIRTLKLFPTDPDRGEGARDTRCPLAAVAGCYTETDVCDFADRTELDDDLCSDIMCAADNDAGVDPEGNPRSFTTGRYVESLPDLRDKLLRACGLPTV